MLLEANGNEAVAERRLLDSVDESTGEMDLRLESAVPKSSLTQRSTSGYENEKDVHLVQHIKETSLNSSDNEDIGQPSQTFPVISSYSQRNREKEGKNKFLFNVKGLFLA